MRICMLTSAPLPPCEGIGHYVWNLSRYLIENRHQVQIITRGRAGRTSREVVEGITIWRPPFAPVYPFHVHLHGVFADKLIRRLEADLDLLHMHSPLVPNLDTGLPKLVTIHTPMKADAKAISVSNPLGLLVKLQAPVSYRLEKEMLNRANRLVAVACSVAEELQEYGVNPADVAVLGNAVDTRFFYPGKNGNTPESPYFLTAGRLGPRKGLEDLISCAEIVIERHPEVRFLIAGAGPLEKELRSQIVRKELAEQVILLGHISNRQQLLNLYRGATAYVHAAHYEGLPTVLLEAMACGRPVIATAISGALDVVREGQNGLLVPPRSPQKMAHAILRLLDNPQLGESIGRAAVQTVRSHYSWELVGRRYISEYEKLLQENVL
ncbi:MAG: glycosyltransferase family 4 protein [Omnitrophica WOR_2 bacterium]